MNDSDSELKVSTYQPNFIQIAKALSNPVRLGILQLTKDFELPQAVLAQNLNCSAANICVASDLLELNGLVKIIRRDRKKYVKGIYSKISIEILSAPIS